MIFPKIENSQVISEFWKRYMSKMNNSVDNLKSGSLFKEFVMKEMSETLYILKNQIKELNIFEY